MVPKSNGPLFKTEPAAMVSELEDAGLYVARERIIVLTGGKGPPTEKNQIPVERGSWKPRKGGGFLFGEKTQDHMTITNSIAFVAYPMRRWFSYTKGHTDWDQLAEDGRGRFEKIMKKHGYLVGSWGGNPLNVDYNKEYPDGRAVTFMWNGNPYHI